ncbi:MAG TPA: transcription antitermination factor NusB [Streptosporangiaceae bacterium]|nr:transcription antitermination factor NusB [Streptosporangiaceae bacterium]
MARIDPARRVAFDVLRAVADRDAYANLLLPSLLTERGIAGRDARFATELTYGTLRGLGSYDAILAACSDRPVAKLDPAVRDILRLGTHQLLGTRTGAHAAVSTSVDLTRRVVGPRPSGFVNAVLRRVAMRDLSSWLDLVAPDRAKDETGYLSVRHSYPRWIVESFRAALADPAELEQALAAGNERPEVTLAVLPLTPSVPIAGTRATRWSPFGAVLADGGDPAPLIAGGRAAAQDEASQLVALALNRVPLEGPASASRHWLDVCAGPGGKARLLAHLAARDDARLLAAELHPHRAARVREALGRGADGHVGTDVVGAPALLEASAVVTADGLRPAWRAGGFDRVLADVPCTGLGSLRRRPEARWRKSDQDLPTLTELQRGLLEVALDSARLGGVVAYVTCSPHLAETRDVVTAVADRRTDAELLDAPAILPEVPDLATPGEPRFAQFWPHRHGTDAMFLALLRKR